MIPDGMGDVLARIDQLQGLLDRLNPEVAPSSQVPTSPGDFQNQLAALLQPAAPDQLVAGNGSGLPIFTGEALPGPVPDTTATGFEANLPTAAAARSFFRSHGRGKTADAPEPIRRLVREASKRYGVDEALVLAVIQSESGFNPQSVSPAGAKGLMQLMPATSRELGVNDPFDPAQNIDGGVRYLRQMLDSFGGDVKLAVAAYNAGPGAVRRHGGVPPFDETQAYVPRVLARAEAFRAAPSTALPNLPAPPVVARPVAPAPAVVAPPQPAQAAPAPAAPSPRPELTVEGPAGVADGLVAPESQPLPEVTRGSSTSRRAIGDEPVAEAPATTTRSRSASATPPASEQPPASTQPLSEEAEASGQPPMSREVPPALPSSVEAEPVRTPGRAPQWQEVAYQAEAEPAAPTPSPASLATPRSLAETGEATPPRPASSPQPPADAAEAGKGVSRPASEPTVPVESRPLPAAEQASGERPIAEPEAPELPAVAGEASIPAPRAEQGEADLPVTPVPMRNATPRLVASETAPALPNAAAMARERVAAPVTSEAPAAPVASEAPAAPSTQRSAQSPEPALDAPEVTPVAAQTVIEVDHQAPAAADPAEAPRRTPPADRLAAAVTRPLAEAVSNLVEEVLEPATDAVRAFAEAVTAAPEEAPPPPVREPRGDEPERAAPQEPARAEARPAPTAAQQGLVSTEAAQPAQPSREDSAHHQDRRDHRPGVAMPGVRSDVGGEAAPVFSLPEASRPAEARGAASIEVADPQELRQIVVRHARLMRTPSSDTFVVEVRHPEAGAVTVRVVREAEAVHVALQTGHEGLRREVQAQLPELQTALREHGLQLGSFDLGSRQQPEFDRQLTQQPQPRTNQGLLAPPPERQQQAEPAPRPTTGGGLAVWA